MKQKKYKIECKLYWIKDSYNKYGLFVFKLNNLNLKMTMHNWESFQKLIQNWEDQSVKDQFKYLRFDYKSDEWDNVPPVIPRFMFYM